ncbi:MAG: hypothetical protein GX070_10425 [Alcaligenaceae bacterium]|nr:hypothetical protein [Alcaligenaceae bacterium]
MKKPFFYKLLASISASMLATTAFAKIPVYVSSSTPNDPIGTHIVAQLQNQLMNSPSLRLVNNLDQAVARVRVLGADPTRDGRYTALAENVDIVNVTAPHAAWLNIQQHIRICLAESSDSCTRQIYTDLEAVATQYGPQLQQKLGR